MRARFLNISKFAARHGAHSRRVYAHLPPIPEKFALWHADIRANAYPRIVQVSGRLYSLIMIRGEPDILIASYSLPNTCFTLIEVKRGAFSVLSWWRQRKLREERSCPLQWMTFDDAERLVQQSQLQWNRFIWFRYSSVVRQIGWMCCVTSWSSGHSAVDKKSCKSVQSQFRRLVITIFALHRFRTSEIA